MRCSSSRKQCEQRGHVHIVREAERGTLQGNQVQKRRGTEVVVFDQGHGGSISAPGIFFGPFPTHACFCPPSPNNLEYLRCLRIWPILCPQFMEVVGVTFCVVEFSYFGLRNVLCMEGLRSSAAYLGDFPR